MELGSDQWKALIKAGARKLRTDVTDEQVDQFAVHAQALAAWNRKINLTAIQDPREVAVKHFLDAVAAAPYIPPHSRLLDIGSGGGFPGIVLKIVAPQLSVLLIDALRKRVSFLQHVIRTLGLTDIAARHVRAEALALEPLERRQFDIVICRALCTLDDFVTLAMPLRKKNGCLIAMKGAPQAAEITSVKKQIHGTGDPHSGENDALQVVRYRLPYLQSRRTLICIGPTRCSRRLI